LGKSVHNDITTVSDLTSDGKNRQGKNILESKTFRDGGIYLFLRGDYKTPIWFCRIKVPGMTGYIYRSTRTSDEHQSYKFADDLYHRQLVKVLGGEVLSKGTKITVGINSYIERFENDERLSIKYRVLLLKRVKDHLKTETFENLSTQTISKLTDDLRKGTKTGTMSPNTVKRVQNDLRHFFRWCVEEGFLKEVPKLPRINGEQSRRPHFNEKEWRKITRHLREFVKVDNKKTLRERTMLVNYVLILSNTGIRVGEARSLKWRDIREVDGNVILTVNGKTGIREVVSRTNEVRDYIKRIYDLRVGEVGEDKVTSNDLVFGHPDGSEVGSFKKSFQSLLKGCGVEKDSFGRNRTIYSLRHTYATFRLHEGVNHYVLSRNMGTSVKMLEDYYGHTSNVMMSDELTKTKSTIRKSGKTSKVVHGIDPTFGWLKTVECRVSETQKKVRKITHNKEESAGPTYVDLVDE
jgi:integrase